MKVLGIEIKGTCAIFCAMEEDNTINDVTGKITKLEIKDDENAKEIHEFVDILHSHFDEMQFDKIAILKRVKSVKAKYPPSPISFKIEGLIQMYKNAEITFVSPQTIRAFLKKNTNPFNPKYGYQNPSAELAFYLLKK